MKAFRFLAVFSFVVAVLCLSSCSDDDSPSEGLHYSGFSDGTCCVVSIGDCKDKKIIIPTHSPDGHRVTAISDYAFANCDKITSVTIPEGVVKIGEWAFENCTNLKKIDLPDSCIEVGAGAFDFGKKSKYEYTQYDNGYYIGNEQNPYHALVGLVNEDLTSCYINESTKVIGPNAFSSCYGLIYIQIPRSVVSICHQAFMWKLETIVFERNSELKIIADKAFEGSKLRSITIPRGVTTISQRAFAKSANLTEVIFEGQITSIETHAFIDCTSLKSFTIPSTVTHIGSYAFMGCNALTEVVFEDPSGWYANGEAAVGIEDPAVAAQNLTDFQLHGYSKWFKY